MIEGRSVKLFLVDGTATGILTAEIMNWTGHVLAAPRTRFEDAFARQELKRTGVYLLIGPDHQGSELTKVYVGEGDEIGKRLYSHNKDKDFWDRFVAVTSKDMNLTKAHVRYLEGRLLALLGEARKAKIENKDLPQFELLPEADISDMEAFLEEIQLVLPVIGVESFKRPNLQRKGPKEIEQNAFPNNDDDGRTVFSLSNKKAGISASAYEFAGEFVVQEGATGALREKSSFHDRIKALRDEALETGRIVEIRNSLFQLTQDISFTSPSAASVFLFGTSRNGRTDWIVEGRSQNYGEWKESLIEKKLQVSNSEE